MTSAAALIATWSEASALSSLLAATVTRQTMRCEMAETVESRARWGSLFHEVLHDVARRLDLGEATDGLGGEA